MSLFTKTIVDENVTIFPNELNSKINDTLMFKIKDKLMNKIVDDGEVYYDGKCTQYGYIDQVTKIVEKERNPKVCDNGKGECIMNIKVEIKRCLPKKGDIITCEVSAFDEHIGEPISFEKPLFILIINETGDVLKAGDKVRVKIDDFQLKHGDSIINIVGSYVSKV